MKVILVGHPGSQKIRKASEYLTSKYLPGFDVMYINYEGLLEFWGQYMADYFKLRTDKEVIFALDDYLPANHIGELPELGDAVFAKLCVCSAIDNSEYPVTTQYTLWNREYLISLLEQVKTPWEFEIEGSRLFKESGKKALFTPILNYFTNSSLSKRWDGVRLDGLKEEDIKMVQQWI